MGGRIRNMPCGEKTTVKGRRPGSARTSSDDPQSNTTVEAMGKRGVHNACGEHPGTGRINSSSGRTRKNLKSTGRTKGGLRGKASETICRSPWHNSSAQVNLLTGPLQDIND